MRTFLPGQSGDMPYDGLRRQGGPIGVAYNYPADCAQILQSRFGDQGSAGGGLDGTAYDTLRRALPELEIRLRQAIAERLAERPDVPHDIIITLASDRIVVARAVLIYSPVLEDDDIIELIHNRSREHHLAIAQRRFLAPDVCEILVEMGDHEVMVTLLENDGANFARHTLLRLVSASRHIDMLREPLLRHPSLNEDLARVMYGWVNDRLRVFIAERFGAELVAAIADIRQPDGARALTPCPTAGAPLVEPMLAPIGNDRRSSPLVVALVKAIRDRDLSRLEASFADLTGLPPFAVARVLHNPNPEPLAVVCRALSLKRPLFAALYTRLHGTQSAKDFEKTEQFRSAMTYFNRLQGSQAARILETWKRAPITVWHNPAGWKARASWAS